MSGISVVLLIALRSTIVLCGALVIAQLLRRAPAAERHLVWLVALAGVLLLPVIGLAAPAWRVGIPVPGAVVEPSPVPTGGAADAPLLSSSVSSVSHATSDMPDTGVAAESASVAGLSSVTLPSVLFAIWLTGVLIMLGGTLLGLLHVGVLARRARPLRHGTLVTRVSALTAELGIRAPIRVLEGGEATMPMTFGLLRPSLLLPSAAAEWPAARQNAVLRHELTHIRRRDSLTQLIADLACALYWFHPLVWVAAARLRLEREHACDDAVLLAGARGSDYAAELLSVARSTRVSPLTARAAHAMARSSGLRTRLTAVLEERTRAERVARKRAVPASVLAGLAVFAVATLTPERSAIAIPVVDVDSYLALTTAGSTRNTAHAAGAAMAPDPRSLPIASQGTHSATCFDDVSRGRGMSVTQDGSGMYRMVHRDEQGLELCLSTSDGVDIGAAGLQLERLSAGARLTMAARMEGRSQSMEIVQGADGPEHSWYVNGAARAFDATARQWRDEMLAVLNGYAQISAVRGEVASLRGQAASVRGQEASLRGEIASMRGREARLRSELAAARGRDASLRGEVASVRGREAALRAEITAARGRQAARTAQVTAEEARIRSIEAARRDTRDAGTRERLARELEAARTAQREAERQLGRGDIEARVAGVERQLAGVDAQVREIEARVRSQQSGRREAEVEARITALNAEGSARGVASRIAQLDVAGRLRAIESRIASVDAEQRIAELEAALAPRLAELRRLVRSID